NPQLANVMSRLPGTHGARGTATKTPYIQTAACARLFPAVARVVGRREAERRSADQGAGASGDATVEPIKGASRVARVSVGMRPPVAARIFSFQSADSKCAKYAASAASHGIEEVGRRGVEQGPRFPGMRPPVAARIFSFQSADSKCGKFAASAASHGIEKI